MGLAKRRESWTVAEYLAMEKTSPVRHEYVDGQIYAMTGTSKNHNRISVDLGARFNEHLVGGNCEAFVAEVKVRVRPTVYYYPDVVVTCAPPVADEEEDDYIAERPVLIVEVLSKSTARTDQGEKKIEYQQMPGLREYVIIAQDCMRVEVYRHTAAGAAWEPELYTDAETTVQFAAINMHIRLADIYRRVKFADPAESENE